MKQAILCNWNFMRVLRLIIGVAVIAQAVVAKEFMFAVAGIVLASLAIFNIGCCAAGSCYTSDKPGNETSKKDISYEEVV